jgi:DNA-binding NarL/FixJ family response regulator
MSQPGKLNPRPLKRGAVPNGGLRVVATEANGGEVPSAPVRIAIASRHPITLDALKRLFEDEGFEVVACCKATEECLPALRNHRPHILVLDGQFGGIDDLAVLRDIKRDRLTTRTVLLTDAPDEAQVLEAIRLGARGMVLKEMPAHLLVQCVREVHKGEQWFEKQSAGRLLEKLLKREVASRQLALDLTRRELEILHLVASGLRNKTIAEQLFLKEGTVKIHLHNMYKKLNVSNRLALTLFAQRKGLT